MESPDSILQAIFDQTALGIAQISLDGVWLRVNDRYCQMLGYSESELGTKMICDITHPEDNDEVLAGRRQLLEGAVSSHSMEKRYIRKDGTVFWGRLNRSLVRNHDNQPKYFIAMVEDITEKIEAERALRDGERQLVLAQNAARLGIWDRDLRTGVTSTSGEYARLLGLTPDRLPRDQEERFQLLHPGDRERVRAEYQESLERGHVWATEFRVVWPDGSIHWLLSQGQVFRDDARRPVRLSGIILDITERKNAEATLRESQERYKEVFDTTSDCIFLVDVTADARFKCARFNPAAENAVGLSNAEASGKFVEDMVSDKTANSLIAHYRHCLEVGTPIHYEEELFLPGGYGFFHTNLIPLRNGDGRIYRIVGISRDITAQRQSEEALRISQQRLELAQGACGVGTWDWDVATDVTHCSSGYLPLYGLPPGDIAPKLDRWLELVYPEDRGRVREEIGRVFERIDYSSSEFRVVWPDGTIHWLHVRGQMFRDSLGNPIRLMGVNMDISERKRAETALRENEQHLKNAERLAHVGHFQWDLRSNAVSGSEEMYRIFGQPQSYTPSYEDFVRMLVPQDRERVASTIRDAIEKKVGRSLEYQIITPNGDLRMLACTLEVLLDEDGLPVRLFGACRDITDSRRSQEEGLARQKLESLGALANGIAHDFNNLLGSIMAQAELLKADLVAGLSPDGAIEGIKTVAIHGAEIVRALMTYAGQDQEGFFEPVDLSRLTAEMLELLKVSISKHARLEINLEKNLPAVLGNAPQIRQVLMNLIINASEALGEKEGVIRVTASRVTGGNDSALNDAANMPAGDYVRLEVSDNGSGMTEEAKPKIFDPFYTTKFAGRGLGLAVVQGIVRAHGGSINVVSAPGQGATFQVLLPTTPKRALETQNAVASARPGRSHTLTRPGATVLVVEDEEVLRRAVSKALRIKGFSVLEAKDGDVALDLLRTHRDEIDVILLDITLPGASSREVFEEAQRIRENPKIVLTSAYDRRTVDAFFPGLRITQFIRKPFQLDDLAGTLRDALAS